MRREEVKDQDVFEGVDEISNRKQSLARWLARSALSDALGEGGRRTAKLPLARCLARSLTRSV